ncbi:hypothetical protein NW762_012402 [Fusarium torreyae]|uniref:Uncharacterized protein n=1 Tax=Fusarium torreyae TaxID=1237075 RepID=A0A9W8RR37_9HYPO|nr:hypothetical protein NW762_012402 [Fusarium torreyae]
MKFVHNGRHEATPTDDVPQHSSQPENSSTTQWGSMIHVSSRREPNGGSYGLLRLVPPPRSAPTTTADRVSASWVAQFEIDPKMDLLKTLGYSPLLPCRVGESSALRDVLALFSSTWSHFKRGKTVGGLIDAKVYAKAIRSLRRAIEHSTKFATCETLAATVLLERFEVLFDTDRSYHRCIHARGVYSILARKGPPKLTDELDVCLALESQGVVQSHCLAVGDDNFYHNPEWQSFLDQALSSSSLMSYEQRSAYRLERFMDQWPIICQKLHELLNSVSADDIHAKALALHNQLTTRFAELRSVGEALIIKFGELGHIKIINNSKWMPEQEFEFSDLFAQRCFTDYYVCSIVLNRILYETSNLLGKPNAELDAEYKTACRHVWMCYPFQRRVGLLAEVLFVGSLILTYEGADDNERAHLLNCFREQDKFRKRLPTEDKPLESYILHTARIITGRTYLPSQSSLRAAPLRQLTSDRVMALCEENSLL